MKPLPGPVAVPPVLAPLPAGCHLHSNKVLSVLSTGPLAPVWSLSLLPPGLFLDLDREVSGGHAPGPERPGNAHACGWGVGPVYTPWTQPPSPEHELSSLDVGVLKSSIYCPTFEHVPPRVLLGAKWEPVGKEAVVMRFTFSWALRRERKAWSLLERCRVHEAPSPVKSW